MKLSYIFSFLIITVLFLYSCGGNDSAVYNPKPRAFPKIEFPTGEYTLEKSNTCPFSFERANYAEVIKDTLFFNEKPENDCWFDLYIPSLKGKIHCSYYAIDQVNNLDKLITDAHTLSNKHGIKAEYIDDFRVSKPGKVYGNVMNIEGDVATPFQFYLTDSTQHFLRGSLYINAQVNADSLAPVYEFLKKDAMHMINTFSWSK